MESWVIIKNHENYSVSDQGEIKNTLTGELLKKHDHPRGYDQVYFDGCTFLVHKLVCEAYHENPEKKPCVDHIDGNKKNNTAQNLRWASYHENNSNPKTCWKNHREPWNKGITITDEVYLDKIRASGKLGAAANKRKTIEKRSPST